MAQVISLVSQHHSTFPLCLSKLGVLFICFLTSYLACSSGTQTFIVRVETDFKPLEYTNNIEDWYTHILQSLLSKTNTTHEEETKPKFIIHVYKTVFHGFSARLTQTQAEELKTCPGVLGVYPDRFRQIQTTRTPHFLGLTDQSHKKSNKNLLTLSDYGSNVIIGVLDTGICPERRSFSDEGLGPIPRRWKGECVEAKGFPKSVCNKKLIGARFFADGYQAMADLTETEKITEILSPRDYEGHGTHTASTAAGRKVQNASFIGIFANGEAMGMAPKARIAVYKICWPFFGCADSDTIHAFDKAVEDGVDIISFSVSSFPLPYSDDVVAIAAFGATEKGVFVSAAAGNGGPTYGSVANVAPWVTTVGAGTIDRKFPADLVLGDGRILRGTSLYDGRNLTNYPIVFGDDDNMDASYCSPGSLNPKKVRGKIVLCLVGSGSPEELVVKEAGGVGVIIVDEAALGDTLASTAYLLPGLAIGEASGNLIREYIAKSDSPRGKMFFYRTKLGVKPAPIVAWFSSRGPNVISEYIIKPDVIAPGLDILAAWPKGMGPTTLPSDTRRTEFHILSGTSMSCPHVSGIAALLKGANPSWSPARIRSALMTTAYVHDNKGNVMLDGSSSRTSTVWDMGSGHVDPERANHPGLVYDLTSHDYFDFLCASNYNESMIRQIAHKSIKCNKNLNPWDLNYPSISVTLVKSRSINVTRIVTHVGDGVSTYTVKIDNPLGVVMEVDPPKLNFNQKEEKKRYLLRINLKQIHKTPHVSRKTEFGRLTWSDGKHVVGMPVAVTW